ncbi:MAG: DUF5053 domain-containing protein [Muribaculaceae bacterium]|nr:DUF5053 domain-containing protein [Muribaculaceae bacterium]
MANEDLINEIIQRAESEEGQRIADETLERLKNGKVTSDKLVVDLGSEDIAKVLKVSYIAKRFFGRSRSWLCHKLNNDIVNGKHEGFTIEERNKLKSALVTIACEIQNLSDSL